MKIKTTYRIKAEYNYFRGTFDAPRDGYLRSDLGGDPIDFNSVAAAYAYLTDQRDTPGAMWCEYDGDAQFSVGGCYVTSHGQYARPVYTIVTARGRRTADIILECDTIAEQSAEIADNFPRPGHGSGGDPQAVGVVADA